MKKALFALFITVFCSVANAQNARIYLRVNQIGYVPTDIKQALAFSRKKQSISFELVDIRENKPVWGPVHVRKNSGPYGRYLYHYLLDFSSFRKSGIYKIRIVKTGEESLPFRIGLDAYHGLANKMLIFMRQQRCGYNPFMDQVCHHKDGRTAYGPMPDGTYIDVSGGWHDAGDFLKYLMTSSNTVGRLLFCYQENPAKFPDSVDALGHPIPNGIPDVLDEAKWGLDWMLKMHPAPDELFHQVADDRDHLGVVWKLPSKDSANYGWGPGSYRVVYYATGKPQGLGKYKNTSTGIANLAGRYAAVMAMAARIWEQDLSDTVTAHRFLKAARQVYKMGLAQPGNQEGTPYLSPFRYHESTWADDMEWGATELYKVTGTKSYLDQAIKYARKIGSISWMGKDTTLHYQYYPFMNLGHFELYPLVDKAFQDTLAGYYRTGLQAVYDKAKKNPYLVGFPFIWCSNNLASALINQEILYEKMTGDKTYRKMALAARDWILGRNPWGVSQLIGFGTHYPTEPQNYLEYLTHRQVTGGLVDGPVYASIYERFKRFIQLSRPDPYAAFQSDHVVYHDDWYDFSTNEPTLDGTAEAMVWMSFQ